jgi:hypothetical protein
VNVILDECLPRRLVRDLGAAHRVTTVPRQGWAGLSDKELLEKIPLEFKPSKWFDPDPDPDSEFGFIPIVRCAPAIQSFTIPVDSVGGMVIKGPI